MEAEAETGETSNLAQDYLDGDPSNLSEDELLQIAKHFDLSEQQMKTIAKRMSQSRSQIDPTEVSPEQG